jgi:hypothetical protein
LDARFRYSSAVPTPYESNRHLPTCKNLPVKNDFAIGVGEIVVSFEKFDTMPVIRHGRVLFIKR